MGISPRVPSPVTRLRHYDHLGTARFVTFSCYMRRPYLLEEGALSILAEEIDRARILHSFRLLGHVFMPEHVHLVLWPPDGMKLGLVIGGIKARSARRFFAGSGIGQAGSTRVFWQRRCYDHNCRTPETVREKINYCHNNPVRRGLIHDPSLWMWSSYNAYQGRVDIPPAVEPIPL